MNRILLTGAAGQVGQELHQALTHLGAITALDRHGLNLAEPDAMRPLIRALKPDLIVNAAAYTAVDKAEQEAELAERVNGVAPAVLAEEAQRLGSALLHISTDYVFNGCKSSPYQETDDPSPMNVYGRSKLSGEKGIQACCDRHIILRTAWVYGVQGTGNFVKTMLRLGAEREELRVVYDQVGTPSWANDIAGAIARLSAGLLDPDAADAAAPGIYHFTNSGAISWYDFAIAIFEEARSLGFPLKIQRVVPITTADYPTPARRPAYSVLAHEKISAVLGTHPPYWRQSLRKMLTDLYAVTL